MRVVSELVQAAVVTAFALLCAVQLTSCSKGSEAQSVTYKMNAKEIDTLVKACVSIDPSKSGIQQYCDCTIKALAEYCTFQEFADNGLCVDEYDKSKKDDTCASNSLHFVNLRP